ncbi:hypothetical protein BJX76DRAFT_323699 [Aspergillus varians]
MDLDYGSGRWLFFCFVLFSFSFVSRFCSVFYFNSTSLRCIHTYGCIHYICTLSGE